MLNPSYQANAKPKLFIPKTVPWVVGWVRKKAVKGRGTQCLKDLFMNQQKCDKITLFHTRDKLFL